MRLNFSASWIFQGWITHLVFALCTQTGLAVNCDQEEYEHKGLCCKKCKQGEYVFEHCTATSVTDCRYCGLDEYQPDISSDTKCIPQKFCDEGKGFNRTRPHNRTAAVPCRCKQGFHCSVYNCEFCEPIEKCPPGEGVVRDETTDRASCAPCQYGFSDSLSIEACKKWTDCKAIGKTEKQPGSTTTDVVCGLHSPGYLTPWVVVAILSVVIVISLVVLFLFCCKDKMNFLSVNLRTCVQNLKGSRSQQETVIPSHHLPNSLQTCPLICPDSLIMCPSTTLTITDETCTSTDQEQVQDQADASSGSSCGDSGSGPASPLSGSSCSCVLTKEPIEVGENEDCSQLVPTGPATCCSCRTGDPVDTSAENVQVISLKEPLLCENCSTEGLPACAGSADYVDLQRSQELYFTGKEAMSEIRGFYDDRGQVEGQYRQNEPCCCSIDSTTIPPLPSVSANDQGLSLIDSNDNKLSDPDADPEYQNQCSEAALTSGQVTGNNNTTFISSGQVMNFSGEVIVVYVSQTSLGSGGTSEEPFSCPVQEESNDDSFQSDPKSSTTAQGKNGVGPSQRHLPVQEVTNDWSLQK
ncbi:tumor necrosis factor receptor superfamily member 11A [Misgurnus anguillicaudatus]|uniref:tumor necrosis factor receptor superfamily member 11A n=1 Tax=Misgurnus anguillicaudatus TaxID=75329 RepID=UPI003CCFD441